MDNGMIEQNCTVCKTTYLALNRKRKHFVCSERCYEIIRGRVKTFRQCLWCKKEYKSVGHKYKFNCSDECIESSKLFYYEKRKQLLKENPKQKVKKEKPKVNLVCSTCNNLFATNTLKKKFCTIACQPSRNKLKNCLQCNKEFKTIPEQLFCSKSCSFKHWHKTSDAKVLLEKKALNRIANKQFPVTYSMLVLKEIAGLIRIKKAKWQKSYESKTSGNKSYKQCNHCNTNFVYMVASGCPPKYCLKCKDLVFKKHKTKGRRIAKSKRRARIKGLHYESIDPITVFERDKWVCHICKKKTDKRLRGTYKSKAPELDHIVTISEGGSHILENVACSCRSCNNKKSGKSFGQLFLFGGG